MVCELKNKAFLILTIVLIIFTVTGCASFSTNGNGNANANRKYYTGYNSVEMNFLQDSPPAIFYYDSEADDMESNTIPIHVEVYNKGSSDTFGALFIHGFDPNIVAVGGYTRAYPYSTYTTGAWNTPMFSGWFSSTNAFSISGLNIPVGDSLINLGFTQLGDRKIISFSSFNVGGRSALFNALRYGATSSTGYAGYTGINTGVAQMNIGAALNPITEGMFSAYGWNYGWLQKFTLEGRNRNNPMGGMNVIEFPATILTLPPSLEEFRQRIMVTSCFDYATHASTMVCLDPEPYSNVKKACSPVTVSAGGGQGAPVAITTIEQRPGRGRTTFTINVHHSKGGYDELYDYFNLYKCDPASGQIVKTTDKNIVYIGYVYLSNFDITMSCIPDQMIRLDSSGNGQITCSIIFPEGMATSAFEAPLEVELWYGYSKTIYRDMIIRRI
jgi:hypothetical protein